MICMVTSSKAPKIWLKGLLKTCFYSEKAFDRWCYSFYLRYTEVANNVQKEETVFNIEFVLLDCSPLKFALLSHCNEWQNKFTTLLNEMASSKLMDLHKFLIENNRK